MHSTLLLVLILPLARALPESLAAPGAGSLQDEVHTGGLGDKAASSYPDKLAPGVASFQADIRADTNRDGHVDIQNTTDVEGKDNWTETRGALFLANIADTGSRCLKAIGNKFENLEALARCNDASDDVQRAPQNMATIRTLPIPGLSLGATGTISVSNNTARQLVRIFRPVQHGGGGWEIVRANTSFSAEDLAKGLTLGIDARDTRRHWVWDGRATVTFTVTDRGQRSTDSVMLRVAPVLAYHHLQRVERVYASRNRFPAVKRLIKRIEALIGQAKIPGPVTQLSTTYLWVQDLFEPAYMSMPGPDGTAVTLRVMVDAAPRGRKNKGSNLVTFTDFNKDGFAAVQYWDKTRDEGNIDHMGNLETIPPYEHNGRRYPAGRIVMGGYVDESDKYIPLSADYFGAQETQSPIILNSAWLHVEHVDEFIQFLPAQTPRGWCIMINDPQAGIQLLRDIQDRGFGKDPVVSRPIHGTKRQSIDSFLATEIIIRANNVSSRIIQDNIDILKRETGITDGEIFYVPALYAPYRIVKDQDAPNTKATKASGAATNASTDATAAGTKLRRWQHDNDFAIDPAYITRTPRHGLRRLARRDEWDDGILPVNAYLPAAINGLILSDSLYLSPKPWGPVVNGTDVFMNAVKEAYGRVNYTVEFIDDWELYKLSGDVHCATNTLRQVKEDWWS